MEYIQPLFCRLGLGLCCAIVLFQMLCRCCAAMCGAGLAATGSPPRCEEEVRPARRSLQLRLRSNHTSTISFVNVKILDSKINLTSLANSHQFLFQYSPPLSPHFFINFTYLYTVSISMTCSPDIFIFLETDEVKLFEMKKKWKLI